MLPYNWPNAGGRQAEIAAMQLALRHAAAMAPGRRLARPAAADMPVVEVG